MKYLKVFVDFRKDIEPLTDEERGRLFTAMLVYMEDGTEPDLIGNERFLWGYAKKWMDKQKESYSELCERNKKNITARYDSLRLATNGYGSLPNDTNGMKTKTKNKTNKKEILSKESKERSPHPSIEDVEEYVREAGLAMDPRAFFDHYTSNGWKVGGKAPMKDWRAAARNWARRERPSTKNHTPSAYKNADLERLEVQL